LPVAGSRRHRGPSWPFLRFHKWAGVRSSPHRLDLDGARPTRAVSRTAPVTLRIRSSSLSEGRGDATGPGRRRGSTGLSIAMASGTRAPDKGRRTERCARQRRSVRGSMRERRTLSNRVTSDTPTAAPLVNEVQGSAIPTEDSQAFTTPFTRNPACTCVDPGQSRPAHDLTFGLVVRSRALLIELWTTGATVLQVPRNCGTGDRGQRIACQSVTPHPAPGAGFVRRQAKSAASPRVTGNPSRVANA
jgi:hypothetical protein